METFIYGDLKMASIHKDFRKILTLGPYAYTITQIIYNGFRINNINLIFFAKSLMNSNLCQVKMNKTSFAQNLKERWTP